MNFFSSDTFLSSAARAYFPRGGVHPGWVSVDGQSYRVLLDEKNRPQTALPFLDVLEPGTPDGPTHPVRSLAPVETGRITADFWRAAPRPGLVVAPFVDWSRFETFDQFIAASKQNSHFAFRQKRKRKALKKLLGEEVVFLAHDPRPALLDQCLAWKSQQYVESGFIDVMRGGAPELFRALLDDDALLVSSLCAGDALLAVHLGVRHEGVFYYWVPAYDPSLRKHSPGTLLIEDMMQASFDAGDAVFDFLEGSEPYKFIYATDVRKIGTAGQISAAAPLVRAMRQGVSRTLQKAPGIYQFLKAQKRRRDERQLK